ncbi:3-hydroxyacyl-CoA dehydrogenase [Tardiphaga alba]|uniref:3-hydroxyacyl-CoA dehydrogenase n=1 Tax=Tardiphaga alba TaxID=340268 RepID=A0ABX8AFK5_9BRAD|nr:3-hydroxyacyl-CoA dehydrogenase NAD-binding domain-containing protein [Tardiphaga alba]QUS41100.1 3-hydroxyacyl-CoA dehydrogenase [Tardiphaga alba]
MPLIAPNAVRHVAIVGSGTIGASWAALFLAHGLDVTVYDPQSSAEATTRALITNAWQGLVALGVASDTTPKPWRFTTDLAEALRDAEFVQESGPERADIKRQLYAQMEACMKPDAIVASSTSGLVMSELQVGLKHPERFAVGHPFNPPHLVPLVEIVGGKATSPEVLTWLDGFYRHTGKAPIRLNKEVPGHLANRLQAALWREAVHAVASGIASVEDVDTAIAQGPGLRWAIMGPHMIFSLAGGEGGMKHFLDHIGPAMEDWWRDLGTPQLGPEVNAALIEGIAQEAAGRSRTDLVTQRDAALIALIKQKNS